MIATSKLVEWAAFGVTVLGGGMWLGSLDSQVTENTKQLEVAAPVGTQLAVLTEKVGNLEEAVSEVKEQQKEILTELRKK